MARAAWTRGKYQWRLASAPDGADELGAALNVGPLVGKLLALRGIDTAEAGRAFLEPKLTDLHDPAELGGATEAAERLARAVADGRRIVLYGDYDVDGMTGVAILHACLRMLGAEPTFYVPHRVEEGYGVNAEAACKLADAGMEVMVTVDCGIRAVEPVAELNSRGVEVIVTDHHHPGEQLPDAAAIVHPTVGADYPNPHLAGAGVAFKLAWQLARAVCGNDRVDEPMRKFLLEATCLAALGTIADVVPLLGENRVLARFGLLGLPSTEHPGLAALLECANLTGERLDAFDVGFRLGPRLNACGRMGHAAQAVELLTAADADRSREIAATLNQLNTRRQQVERDITAQAHQLATDAGMDGPDWPVIVLAGRDWHAGVIGISAARLVDRFAKPTVLIAINGDGTGQGSARSVEGFHLADALTACGEHLLSHGGHAMAGGLRIRADRVDAFADAMRSYALEHAPKTPELPPLNVEVEARLGELTFPAVETIARMAPFGQANPAPRVLLRDCEVINPPRRIGKTGQTITMTLGDGPARMRAVGFGMGELAEMLEGIGRVDIVAEPVLNRFRGRVSAELHLVDVNW